MPSALITGATGFIGSHLADELSKRGYKLRALVRDSSKTTSKLTNTCEIVTGDLESYSQLREAVADVDYVFHCAANVSTWDSSESYQKANVDGVTNLCRAIADANPNLKRLIHLSTVDVYDFPDHPADEDLQLGTPSFSYGASKLLGERRLTEVLGTNRIPFCILRPCNVIASGSPFISRIGDAFRRGIMLEIDRGTQHAGLLSIQTLIDCMIWAAESPAARGQTFNVRNPEDMNWHDFLVPFKNGIHGRGILLNLPYSGAKALGTSLSAMHRLVAPKQEPLWHPLLTELFGKTCGHSINQIQAAGAPLNKHSLEEAIADSIQWYNQQHA